MAAAGKKRSLGGLTDFALPGDSGMEDEGHEKDTSTEVQRALLGHHWVKTVCAVPAVSAPHGTLPGSLKKPLEASLALSQPETMAPESSVPWSSKNPVTAPPSFPGPSLRSAPRMGQGARHIQGFKQAMTEGGSSQPQGPTVPLGPSLAGPELQNRISLAYLPCKGVGGGSSVELFDGT